MIKELPNIGMGTWQIESKEDLFKIIKAGIEAGYKHIDTAQGYDNETQIGEVLNELGINRNDIFLTSKIWPLNFAHHAMQSLKESLSRLQVDQLDLILLHAPLRDDVDLKAYKEMIKAREEGLIRFVGVSNFSIKKLKLIHNETGEWPYVNQIVATPTFRAEELENFCKEKGIKLTGYSVMKPYFNPNPFFKGSGMDKNQKSIVDKIAKRHNKNQGQILNRWAIQLGYSIIPKSSNPLRVTSNFDIFNFEISKEEMEELNSFNTATENSYKKLINSWSESVTGEQEKKGLLFNKNFKPGK